MRLMLVGLTESNAKQLFEGVGDIAENGGFLQDWTAMEGVVNQTRPEVVAIYLGPRPSAVLGMVRRVRSLFPAVNYIAITETDEKSMISAVSEAGCADLVLLNECPRDLRRALKVIDTRDGSPSASGEAICLIGAKGGVGTTTTAINLAAHLASRGGQRVILVDLHLYLGDVAVMLDLRPKPSVLWFLHRGTGADGRTWADAPPRHNSGFRVLGLDGRLAAADPVSAEQVVFLIERLKDRYEHVVVDAGSDMNEVSLAAASASETRLLLVNEDAASRTGARRRVAGLVELDLGPVAAHVVVNRSTRSEDRYLMGIEQFVGAPLVGTLENDWKSCQGASERGQPLAEFAPKSKLNRDMAALVQRIAGASHEEHRRKKTFFSFFR